MALTASASGAAARFSALPIIKQVGILVGLAASIALGVGVVLWSREPNFMPVFSQLSPKDAAEVVDVLQRNSVPFRVDESHGLVMVPTADIQSIRMKLAKEGLPRNGGGFEFLSNTSPFSTSQFMESARYKQALETELARTISQFHDVKSARVHLAIPKESAFVRDNHKPSASVFIDVYSGVEIKKQTVASIINLVASSIPSLSSSRVTVVDQYGQLLSDGSGQNTFTETERYLEYRQSVEQQLTQKIQDILTPLLGYGRVRAKVSADLDFTRHEQTQETYNPDQAAVRSEQKVRDKRDSGADAGGVAGALSNTPPTNPNTAAVDNSTLASAGDEDSESDYHSETIKNYEVDKTISHTKNQPGAIRRLTVAVLVDDIPVFDPETKTTEIKPLSKTEIDKIRLLVADAIGINPERGDSVNIVNSHFVRPDPIGPVPPEKFWQTDWFWSIMKQVGSAIFVLLLAFGVLRPTMKSLAGPEKVEEDEEAKELPGKQARTGGALEDELILPAPNDFEGQMALLKQIVDKEPKRVAHVVKNWVDKG